MGLHKSKDYRGITRGMKYARSARVREHPRALGFRLFVGSNCLGSKSLSVPRGGTCSPDPRETACVSREATNNSVASWKHHAICSRAAMEIDPRWKSTHVRERLYATTDSLLRDLICILKTSGKGVRKVRNDVSFETGSEGNTNSAFYESEV